jgi:D-lyxose ketol-isomerase
LTKWNVFVVSEGRVGVRIEAFWPNEGRETIHEQILGPGDELHVPPGMFHEFVVYENGVMLEEMYVKYDDGDILRQREGGPVE